MTNREFEEVFLPRYRKAIAAIARKFASTDDELFADLKQEGMIALLNFDPRRVSGNEDACVRQHVKFRIVDYLRRTEPKHHLSLDNMTEKGVQISNDPEDLMLTWHRRDVEWEHRQWEAKDEGEEE